MELLSERVLDVFIAPVEGSLKVFNNTVKSSQVNLLRELRRKQVVLSVRWSLGLVITTTTPRPELRAAASTLQACLGSREPEPEVSTMITLRGSQATTSDRFRRKSYFMNQLAILQ